MVGLWGTGSIHDVGVDIQQAEAEIERQWADRGGHEGGQPEGCIGLSDMKQAS